MVLIVVVTVIVMGVMGSRGVVIELRPWVVVVVGFGAAAPPLSFVGGPVVVGRLGSAGALPSNGGQAVRGRS